MIFKQLDDTGHSQEAFEKGNKVSMEEAAARFDAYRAKGSMAYTPNPPGSKVSHRKLDKFDPNVDEIAFHRNLMGG